MYTTQQFPLCQEVTAASVQLMGTLHDSGVSGKLSLECILERNREQMKSGKAKLVGSE